MGSREQSTAAASFFARANQRMQSQQIPPESNNNNLAPSVPSQQRSRRKKNSGGGDSSSEERRDSFPTNFRALVRRSPPPPPTSLLKRLTESEVASSSADNGNGLGRIRVLLRVSRAVNCYDPQQQREHSRHFQVDHKRRQVTLYDPSAFRGAASGNNNNGEEDEQMKPPSSIGVAAPKMFAFDGLFSAEDSQEEVASAALPDLIQSVVGAGSDACLFCFGHANLGKTRTMLGSDECSRDMGAVPIAVAWLYRAIKERKAKFGTRFSVRVSALEVTGSREEVRDLLADHADQSDAADQSPAAYLGGLAGGSVLQNQSEPRASTAEKAAYYLDAALAGRSLDAAGRESHLVFTLHVYQYSAAAANAGSGRSSAGVLGGRSRLHLIDFGGCERTRSQGGAITLSGLGNVILGIFNGQRHLPHRDSKVTKVLRDCLGSLTCQATMLAHVSPEASHYSETLHTVQLASRYVKDSPKLIKEYFLI